MHEAKKIEWKHIPWNSAIVSLLFATDNERNPFDHGARMIKVILESWIKVVR